jgi:AraC-like DNA-binding protein
MEHERWVQATNTLYHALCLPVRLFVHGRLFLSLPDAPDPVWALLTCGGEPASWPVGRNRTTVQYVLGRTGERYICQCAEDAYTLCIGPFCMDTLHDKELNRQLRIYFASVRERETVRAAVQALKRLSEDCCFYTGQLMQMLCGTPEPKQDGATQSMPWDPGQTADELYRHPPFFLEREISQYIAEQDEKNALAILSEINRLDRAKLSDDPLRSLKNSLICSCAFFARAAIAGGAMPDAAFSHSDRCIRTIEDMHDLAILAEFEYTMVHQFIHLVRRRKEGGISAVIRAAIIYANEHLLEPITVQSIADSIYVNPSYLSSCFKQEVGEPLSHYLRRKRIRWAEKLLREGNSSTADIADICQFCSQSHFIQVFKQMKGLTPQQYRRMEGTSQRQHEPQQQTHHTAEATNEYYAYRFESL